MGKKLEESKEPINDDKVVQFSKNNETMSEIADDLIDENDLFGALRVLLEIERSGNYDYTLYRRIADLYTECEMFERSVDYWFRFLDSAPKRFYAEAYNGLGGNYYFLHKDKLAAYYFNLQINDKNDSELPFDDIMYDLYSERDEEDEKPYIRLYDDYEEQEDRNEKAVKEARAIAETDQNGAKERCLGVNENSKYYGEAQYILGGLYLIELDAENSLKCYKEAYKANVVEDISLSNVFALSMFLGDKECEKKAFNELKEKEMAHLESLVKYMFLFTGFNRNDLAYELVKKTAELLPNCGDVLLYYGYTAYNEGDYETAEVKFNEYYNITGEYYARDYAAAAKNCKDKKKEKNGYLEYEFGLQRSECGNISETIGLLLKRRPSEIAGLNAESEFLANEALASVNPELHAAAFSLLSIENSDYALETMKKYLLKTGGFVPVKIMILTLLVEMGVEQPTGIVVDGLYSKIPFERVEFNEECGDVFRSAYALAFGRFVLYCQNEIYKLRVAAYDLYYKFIESGNIRKVKKIATLAALMLSRSGIKMIKEDETKQYLKYIGATAQAVGRLENLLETEE